VSEWLSDQPGQEMGSNRSYIHGVLLIMDTSTPMLTLYIENIVLSPHYYMSLTTVHSLMICSTALHLHTAELLVGSAIIPQDFSMC